MPNIAQCRQANASRYGRLALILVFAGLLAGCQASLDAYPQRPFDTALPKIEPIDSIQVVETFYQKPEAERRGYRDTIIAARIAAINISYRLFEEQLFQEGIGRNIATDWALLGLAGAGATVASSGTQQILAAVSGGLVGARASFDKNALFDRTLPSLVAKMEASRREVEERLLNGMKLDTNAYGILDALQDLDSYYNAGTLPGAIINVAGDAGALKTEILKRRAFSAKSLDASGKVLIPLLTGASGTIDPTKVKQLRTCFGVVGLPADILVVDFLYGGEFIADRPRVLACVQALPAAAAPAPAPVAPRTPATPRSTGPTAPTPRTPANPTTPSPPAVDAGALTDRLTELLKDPQTGLPTKPRVELVRSCYPTTLSKSVQPNQLLQNRSGFAKEKRTIVACVEANDLTDQLEALLKDKTGVATKDRADLAVGCYPATLSKTTPVLDLLLNPTGFVNEKKAIIECMKKS